MALPISFDEQRQRAARNYLYILIVVSLSKWITVSALTLLAIRLKVLSVLDLTVRSFISKQWLAVVCLVLVGYVMFCIVTIPFDYLKEYYFEHKFGLTLMGLRNWLSSKLERKMLVLFALLALTTFLYNAMLLDYFELLAISAVTVLVIFFLLYQPPRFLENRIYNIQSLGNGIILNIFTKLIEKTGVRGINIYEIKTNPRTRKVIAETNGTGSQRRVMLSDTLLKSYSLDEVETVLGHEIAHHKFGHHWKFSIILISAFLSLFCSIYWILHTTSTSSILGIDLQNLRQPTSVAYFPAYALIFGFTYALCVPLMNTLSRWEEKQCDKFELELVKKPEAFISSIVKLCDQNLIYAYPNRLVEFLFYDHPSGKKRVTLGMKYIASLYSPKEKMRSNIDA
jgi:STE24 endopeptidase